MAAHKHLFPTFFRLMLGEMDRHQLRHGDSWLEQDFVTAGERSTVTMEEWLDHLLDKANQEYQETRDPSQLEDIANLCAMRRLRSILKEVV